MKKLLSLVAGALGCGAALAAEPVGVIFDTDMYTDYDDAGALACLHALADAGECRILATVACTRESMSVAMCEIINAYYGRPEIPVGCVRGMGVGKDTTGTHDRFYTETVKKYAKWVKHANSSDAPDALEVYRKVLAAQPDRSVVICSVGFLTNLRRLVETDRDLVTKKVRYWVTMACSYPDGTEYNSKTDWRSSKIALENWPTTVVFTDFQYGRDCFSGRAIARSPVKDNPVAEVFARCLTPMEEINKDPAKWLRWGSTEAGHPSWDETAVLIAVRGWEPYFNSYRGFYRMVGDQGRDEWAPDEKKGRHLRVTEKVSKTEVGRVLDELMMRPPKLVKR